MVRPIVQTYPDLDGLSAAAAAVFAQTVKAAKDAGRPAWVAVSGGSTPRRLYETLATRPWRERIAWSIVHICQVDERPVPPEHEDSNYRLLREALLDAVPLPRENVHRIPAELGASTAADEYDRMLRDILPVRSDGSPRFDLVFLGMGDDGHTASLFPHSPGLRETNRWVIANPVEKLGLDRITLTYPVLNGATRVVFLVSGAAKAAVFRRVVNGGRRVEDYPAQGIAPNEGELVWMVDAAAAGG